VSDPVITFLSDYGLEDAFVGICHGVIGRICPAARVIDITHGIARHDVREGALALRAALRYMPAGVHLAVVDPDVGANRRAVALRTADERLMVGPDNGLLWLAAEDAGGIVEAVDIASSPWRLEPVSATFHGRDVFAPVAAQLADGAGLDRAGKPLDPAELVRFELPSSRVQGGALIVHAIHIDRFGNVQLNASHEQLVALSLDLGSRVELGVNGGGRNARYVRTFADVDADELLLYEDAEGTLAIAVSRGNAAERLGLSVGQQVRIRTA
jgi:S-adenosylmethionine hydrolase